MGKGYILHEDDGAPFGDASDEPLNELYWHLSYLQDGFFDSVNRAYDRYAEHHDWITLADDIWVAFTGYIGFGGEAKGATTEEVIHRDYREANKSNFLNALSYSFDEFNKMPKDEALRVLTRLDEKLRANRDFEALSVNLSDELIQKFYFLINRINGEIRNQERRTDGEPFRVVSSVRKIRLSVPDYRAFLVEKIRHMDEDKRQEFLSINSGNDAFYELTIGWKMEYEGISGKKIKNHSSSMSKAKERYRELYEN